jgi:polysaccharide biosynthesis protein PelB
LAAERLIQLLRDKVQGRESVAIAYKAYQRFHQPRWLLLAMDSAAQFKLWNELRQFIQIADANKNQFVRLEMYWLIRAQYNVHNQNPRQALADYRKAHVVNPTSKIAKEGELWTLIDLQNKVVSRINTASRQYSSALTSECVYNTGFKGSVCARAQ